MNWFIVGVNTTMEWGENASLFLQWSLLTLVCFLMYRLRHQWNWSSDAVRKARFLKDFPGPKPLPILGNGPMLLFKPTEFYKWTWELCQRWGGPEKDSVVTWRLSFPMVWVSSFDTAMQLLSNPKFVAKSQDIDMFWRQQGGNGLSSSPAHIHNSRRKLLNPGYSRQVVHHSLCIFEDETKRTVNGLRPLAASGETFEILEWITPCSFRIICRSAFGDDTMSELLTDYEALRQMHALHEVSQKFTSRLMSPYLWMRNDFIYFNFTKVGKDTMGHMKTINDFGRRVIHKRIASRKHVVEPWASQPNADWNIRSGPPCYLDMLLDFCDKGLIKDTEILGELNNYIVAAYETTALAVAWTLFALALNDPSHQTKICEELDQIFGERIPPSEWKITAADIKNMKYLELCVKEAFRLFPPSPVLPRSTTEDMHLKDGRVIPTGTDVLIMVEMIHRDAAHFPNPLEFRPERHTETNPAFLPFSIGNRNCIGQVFAMHQVKVQLAGLLREFVWRTEDNEETLPRYFQGLMIPAEGIRFRISQRKLSVTTANTK